MAQEKRGGRAPRHQRVARHARRAPQGGRTGNSLAQDYGGFGAFELAVAITALLLTIALCAIFGGPDDREFLERQAQAQAEIKESGAWVMW